MLPRSRLPAILATLAGVLATAVPAHAGRLMVVDGERAAVRDDPLVPPPAQGELGPPPGGATGVALAAATGGGRGRRAVGRALRRALLAHRIGPDRYAQYVRTYRRARSIRRQLRGARGRQLGYVIVTLERIAEGRRLIPSRMPGLFLELERNARFWPRLPYPSAKETVGFRGSEILFRYYPGRGLQIQPLATFVRANLLHGACVGAVPAPCREQALGRLLDEMSGLAVRRSKRFIAWEYLFDFGGGSPPWMSGMAQATGIQALARGAELLHRPDYLSTARRGLGAFETPPPVGVRTRGFRGGTHYLQYSFAPRVYIFNAFTQSVLGLYDYGRITGDARARQLFEAAEPELRGEIPASDVGDWSRYSYRGPESDHDYHELLREVLESMCVRRLGDTYCLYADRYRRYQTEPPILSFEGPARAAEGRYTRIGFSLSKLSAVELTVLQGQRVAFHRIATFRLGQRYFPWRPRAPGAYTVRLAAKELRTGKGLKARSAGGIEVEARP